VKISINDIRIKERIRKEIKKIDELAEDIRQNGLISPIAVMDINGGEYQLLAGLRRIKAIQELGWTEVEANVITPKDAEEILRIEISENEQREQFTPSEKLDYGRRLERLETVKAVERKSIGGQGGFKEDKDGRPYLERGQIRDIIGRQLGMSGKQYERLKYIEENAPSEIMDQLDRGERTINGTYDEIREAKKVKAESQKQEVAFRDQPTKPAAEMFTLKSEPEVDKPLFENKTTPTTTLEPANPPKSKQPSKLSIQKGIEHEMAKLTPAELEVIEKTKAFYAMSPEEKVVELQERIKQLNNRSITAETKAANLKVELDNAIYHRDGIINNLNRQLEKAHSRIKELEEMYEPDKHNV
jgi:ParB family chromosome partitioning protein